MSDQFLGEIRIMGCNFAPVSWALCNGQLMPISQNTALFSLLGTYYGGDGKSTFALPNLQGNAPMMQFQGNGLSLRDLGETGGEQAVTLLQTEMPSHTHAANISNANGSTVDPTNAQWAEAKVGRQGTNLYVASPSQKVNMNPAALGLAGGNLPHNNMPPYLVLNFIIALQGVYPPRQ
ncbi:MAG TPA: tail fiber protein [Candidatus Dormibacteraeota bacterium]|nr:tail fiber protein [Candidatus Dormibacteraeota bacterium]